MPLPALFVRYPCCFCVFFWKWKIKFETCEGKKIPDSDYGKEMRKKACQGVSPAAMCVHAGASVWVHIHFSAIKTCNDTAWTTPH